MTLQEPAVLETWRLEDEGVSTGSAETVAGLSLSQSAILHQRIWWLLLVAGAAALLLETVWIALRKDRL